MSVCVGMVACRLLSINAVKIAKQTSHMLLTNRCEKQNIANSISTKQPHGRYSIWTDLKKREREEKRYWHFCTGTHKTAGKTAVGVCSSKWKFLIRSINCLRLTAFSDYFHNVYLRQQKAWARLRGKNRIIVCRNTRKRLFLRCKVFLIHWILYQNDFYVLFVIDLKIHAIPDLTTEKSGKYNNKAVWNIKINICIHSIHHNCRLLAYNKKHGHGARKKANIFRVRVAKWGAQRRKQKSH